MPQSASSTGRYRVADAKGRIALGNKYAGKRFALTEKPNGTAILTPVVVMPEHDQSVSATALDRQLAVIESLADDWDGHGAVAPDPGTLAYAREVLALLHAGAVANGRPWTAPHLATNERGQVVMEWWRGDRSLTVFIRGRDQVDYLRAWGTDIRAEMDDGELRTLSQYVDLEQWLNAEKAA